MKKRLLILFFLLLAISFVSAETKTVLFKTNEYATVNGKTITFLSVSEGGDVKVSVDGVKGIVEAYSSNIINDMEIEMVELNFYSEEESQITLTLTVQYSCGDNLCNDTETKLSCCTDCGCDESFICVNNICQQNECETDADCDDENEATLDSCRGEPKKCYNEEITSCTNDDNFCPASCDYKNDNDCEPVDECSEDSECDDNAPCTIDSCSGTPKQCSNTKKEGCALNNECVNIGYILNNTYCGQEGFVDQKGKKEPCTYDYECLNNKCKNNLCKGKIEYLTIFMIVVIAVIIIGVLFYFIKKR